MPVAVLSDDHFSAIGIKHCLLEGGITEVVIQQEEPLDELYARAAVLVIDAGWSDAAAIDRFLKPARVQQLPALVIFQEARRPWVSAAVSGGASGVLTRGEARNHLPLAVQALRAGQTWMPQSLPETETVPELSAREIETLRLYCDGLKIDAIARRMHLSKSTVNTYLTRVRNKYSELGRSVSSRLELRREAARDGWISTK